ncbi:MAG TPA: S1C family serine protease, partial [Chthonomonadaceae bacterium]|nr:S1C family serine protease [Chthonomonadaceae bacterium]
MLRTRLLAAWILWLMALSVCGRADAPPEVVERGKRATALVEAAGGRQFGTAFCIERTGFFLTNEHVAGVPGTTVTLVLQPGEKAQQVLTAHVIRTDKEADLALLRVDNPPALTALNLGSIGGLGETQAVLAFGYPFGKDLAVTATEYPSVTVSTGRITALRKSAGELQEIQVDAALNPGNSGGPLLNEQGQVIGVVHMGIRDSGVHFAIPVSRVQQILSASEITFAPPVIPESKQHTAHTFVAEVTQFVQPVAGVTVEMTLNTGLDAPRVFKASTTDGHKFALQAAPLPATMDLNRLTVTAREN